MTKTKKRRTVPVRVGKRRKSKAKRIFSAVFTGLLVMIMLAAAFFLLNDRFWRINGVPTVRDVISFFGGGAKPYIEPLENEAAVYFIDVGQGDCELIRTNGVNILIDSGTSDSADEVAGYLKFLGAERLDIVIATHPHADHIGAMRKILDKFDVGLFIMPMTPAELAPQTSCYEKMTEGLMKNNVKTQFAKAGERFELGEGCFLEIIAPIYYDYDDLNNFSVTARFVHGNNVFLFTGDLEKKGETDLVKAGAELDADVLKVGHHGSNGASCEQFLNKVTPKIAVISAADVNYYGHPRAEVFERLEKAGCGEFYVTSECGNVAVVSDGINLRVETEKALDTAA